MKGSGDGGGEDGGGEGGVVVGVAWTVGVGLDARGAGIVVPVGVGEDVGATHPATIAATTMRTNRMTCSRPHARLLGVAPRGIRA